jgi:hypothetical protein
MEAAVSKIDDFILTLLCPEQCSILHEHALNCLRTFADYYTDSKKLLRMTGNAEWIPNNCQVAVPLQPVEGILEIKAYKDLATTVASFSRAISIQIKNFVTKCKTLNNDHYKFIAIESLTKALPRVAELLIPEAEDPPPINKHHLVAAYLHHFHYNILSMFSASVDELQVVYVKTHNISFPLIPRIDSAVLTLDETTTPHKSLLHFLHSRGLSTNTTPSTNSDTLTTLNSGEDTSLNHSSYPSTKFLSPANKIHNPYAQTPRPNTPSTVTTTQTTASNQPPLLNSPLQTHNPTLHYPNKPEESNTTTPTPHENPVDTTDAPQRHNQSQPASPKYNLPPPLLPLH